MKIAMSLLSYGLVTGGGEIYIKELGKKLNNMGYDIDIICGRPLIKDIQIKESFADIKKTRHLWTRPIYERATNKFTEIYFDALALNINRLSFIPGCYKLLYNGNYDLMYTSEIPSLISALYVKNKKHIPVVAKLCGPPRNFFGFTNKILKKADIIVATGDTVDKIRNYYRLKVIRIDPGVDIDIFKKDYTQKYMLRKKYNINIDDKVLLFVGRLISIKNIKYQFKILKKLLKIRKDIKLLIVGDGSLKIKLLKLRNKMNLQKYIIFIESVSHKNLVHFYNMSDILLLTSYYEACPIVVLEAMACELPIISTDVGGIHYLIKDKKTGFLVKLKNEDEMINNILYLIQNKKICRNMGKKGRKIVEKQFTWDNNAKNHIKLFNKIL